MAGFGQTPCGWVLQVSKYHGVKSSRHTPLPYVSENMCPYEKTAPDMTMKQEESPGSEACKDERKFKQLKPPSFKYDDDNAIKNQCKDLALTVWLGKYCRWI